MSSDKHQDVTPRPWYTELASYVAWYGIQALLFWSVVIAVAWFGGYEGFSGLWFGRFMVVAVGSGILLSLFRYATDRGASNV